MTTIICEMDSMELCVWKEKHLQRACSGDEWIFREKEKEPEGIRVNFDVTHAYEIFSCLGRYWGDFNSCPDSETICRNRRQSPYGTLRRLFLPESQGLLSIFHTHPSRPAPGSADRRMTSHGLSHDCSLCCSSGFCCIRFSRIRFCCTRFCCIHFCCFWS